MAPPKNPPVSRRVTRLATRLFAFLLLFAFAGSLQHVSWSDRAVYFFAEVEQPAVGAQFLQGGSSNETDQTHSKRGLIPVGESEGEDIEENESPDPLDVWLRDATALPVVQPSELSQGVGARHGAWWLSYPSDRYPQGGSQSRAPPIA